MRQGFAHDAVLVLAQNGDLRAPGAAITVALCGDLDHKPPCPIAAHYTHPEPHDGGMQVRVLFATEPELESVVRGRISDVLEIGRFIGPDGVETRWRLVSSRSGDVLPAEIDHIQRLARS